MHSCLFIDIVTSILWAILIVAFLNQAVFSSSLFKQSCAGFMLHETRSDCVKVPWEDCITGIHTNICTPLFVGMWFAYSLWKGIEHKWKYATLNLEQYLEGSQSVGIMVPQMAEFLILVNNKPRKQYTYNEQARG